MKLHYYPETDSLYIELIDSPAADTRAVAEGLNIDLDANGRVVGIDIDGAASSLDLSSLEATGLPITALKAA